MKKIQFGFFLLLSMLGFVLPVTAYEDSIMLLQDNLPKEQEDGLSPLTQSEALCPLYCTSHFGVFHHIQSVAPDGSTVQFEDDSVWAIDSFNQRLTLSWLPSDLIVVCINKDSNSPDPYRLWNNTIVQNVPCSLKTPPALMGRLTHWIVSIDGGKIYLEDGSFWDVSIFDRSIYKQWEVNDSVIIGTNNISTGFMFRHNPNILINANKKTYARCSCEYIKAM